MNRNRKRSAAILLVEDSIDDQIATKRAFERSKLNNTLKIVEDGEQALRYLRGEGEYSDRTEFPRPDLVLLDLNLPKIDGRAVLEAVKKDSNLRTIPIVVLTTSSQEADILRSYELGVNSFITKPVNMEGFIAAIETLQEYWLELVVLPNQ